MERARCYECTSCGGIVRETARICKYCGNSIATVRCIHCFMMNVTEAIYCIGCGKPLGLLPLPLPQQENRPCPRCRTQPLDAFDAGGITVFDCVRCGGQFVGNDVLAVLIARHQATIQEGPKRLVPQNPLSEKITYLPCPVCQELMLRRNFGRASGIIVDVCSLHGTWFDVGELARILSFVGQGGLQQTHSMEATERNWLKEQSRARTLTASNSDGERSSVIPASSITLSDMEEATRSFVRWVQKLIS